MILPARDDVDRDVKVRRDVLREVIAAITEAAVRSDDWAPVIDGYLHGAIDGGPQHHRISMHMDRKPAYDQAVLDGMEIAQAVSLVNEGFAWVSLSRGYIRKIAVACVLARQGGWPLRPLIEGYIHGVIRGRVTGGALQHLGIVTEVERDAFELAYGDGYAIANDRLDPKVGRVVQLEEERTLAYFNSVKRPKKTATGAS